MVIKEYSSKQHFTKDIFISQGSNFSSNFDIVDKSKNQSIKGHYILIHVHLKLLPYILINDT